MTLLVMSENVGFSQVLMQNGIKVLWDGKRRIYITAPSKMMNKTNGLCGFYDGNQRNDFMTPQDIQEPIALHFGNSWQTSTENCKPASDLVNDDTCDLNVDRLHNASNYCEYLKNEVFSGNFC